MKTESYSMGSYQTPTKARQRSRHAPAKSSPKKGGAWKLQSHGSHTILPSPIPFFRGRPMLFSAPSSMARGTAGPDSGLGLRMAAPIATRAGRTAMSTCW